MMLINKISRIDRKFQTVLSNRYCEWWLFLPTHDDDEKAVWDYKFESKFYYYYCWHIKRLKYVTKLLSN